MSLLTNRCENWAELVLDSPPRNVLYRETLVALVDELAAFAADGAPPLLIRAHGKHFSTGYPIQDIPEEIFHSDPAVRAGAAFERVMQALIDYPSPVVAAIQGDAYGGAVELLACVDLRVAATGVRFAVPPVRLGLVYSHTGLRRLIRGFGSALVRELLLCGEPVDAERAFGAGFLNHVVPAAELLAVAQELLSAIARGGAEALRGTRRVLNLLEEVETLPPEAIEAIAQLRHRSHRSEAFRQAQRTFLERRTKDENSE